MPVNNQHEDYRRLAGRWKRCRDVSDGQDAVHAAGALYLPKLKEQEEDDYRAYVGRATFYNATWRTVAGLKGMLFRKPPTVETPKPLEELLDDVTMSGVPLQSFVETVCEEALKLGRLGVLVDYPTVSLEGATLADAKSQNLRPMLQLYLAERCINWATGRVNNVTVLTLVVLEEDFVIKVDEFTHKCEKRFRVLDLVEGAAGKHAYRVRVFRMKDGGIGEEQIGADMYPQMKGAPLEYIPFTFMGVDDNTPEVDEPPLIDLVNVNLSHYRSTADLEHGAHFTGLPTPWVAGYTPEKTGDKLYIGSQTAWVFGDPNAKCGYLEFTGQGLEALRNLTQDKEKQMAILGARMLEPQKKAVETAESQSTNRKGEESMLACAAQSISLGMTKVLEWFRDWADATGEVKFELNRDFYPAAMTPQMLTALVSGWQMGAYSDQVLFDNLQRGEIIGQDDTLEDEQARLEAKGPPMPDGTEPPLPGAKPGDPGDPKPKPRTTTITDPKGGKYVVQHD